MAARGTGFALLASSSVQEAQDLALVATAATLESRVPFLHFFDGFRTSHELNVIDLVDDATIAALVPDELVQAHRERALSPEHPVLRGSAQNPDVFFQAREAASPYYAAVPMIVADAMRRFEELTGRAYSLFDYVGAPDAERVVVVMGSAAGALEETVEALNADGGRVGLVKVRLYRPFSADDLVAALPKTAKTIAVLDRTKDPAAVGEPLYQDVVTALAEQMDSPPRVIGGRYGLASKEFTPAMAAVGVRRARVRRPAAALHRRHPRRRLEHQPRVRPVLPHGAGRGRARRLLRPRLRRHRRREQELGEDHRRADRAARPGLLRLRLEEVRLDHRLAPALRPRADPLDLPDRPRRLRRLPPVRPAAPDGRPRRRRGGRDVPAEQPLRPRRGVGAPARRRPGADRPKAAPLLCRRRQQGRARRRPRRPRQHRSPAVLLRARRRPPAGRGDRGDQARDPGDVRQARRAGRRAELRGRRSRPGVDARGRGARRASSRPRRSPRRTAFRHSSAS